MLLSIRNLAAFCREDVVVAGGRHVGNDHPVFNPFLEIDVFIQRNVGPIVHQLDGLVDGADAVDPTESLNDANRIPVDVIVDQVIAVLKVLPLGDTVGANQQVQFGRFIWQHLSLLLGARRKKRQQRLEIIILSEG